MDIPSKNEITQWLADCKGAECEALEQLLPLVYDELHGSNMRHIEPEVLEADR